LRFTVAFHHQGSKSKSEFQEVTLVAARTAIDSSGGYSEGTTEIKVDSTTGIEQSNLIRIGDTEIVRVRRVVDATTLRIDPLSDDISNNDPVWIIGYDFGDLPIDIDIVIVDFIKTTSGSVRVRQIRPRIERRFFTHTYARNVADRTLSYWSPEGSEKAG